MTNASPNWTLTTAVSNITKLRIATSCHKGTSEETTTRIKSYQLWSVRVSCAKKSIQCLFSHPSNSIFQITWCRKTLLPSQSTYNRGTPHRWQTNQIKWQSMRRPAILNHTLYFRQRPRILTLKRKHSQHLPHNTVLTRFRPLIWPKILQSP